MKYKTLKKLTSWGRINKDPQKVFFPKSLQEIKYILNKVKSSNSNVLAYGKGRSYGETCLNSDGYIVKTTLLNKVIDFDINTGIIKCEAGITLAELIKIILPRGFFLPVTPGSKFVTLGGAVANDVHGKNHIHSGSFGCFVESFSLFRSNSDENIVCTRNENKDLFFATIGGLGLTGVIEWVEVKLKKINSSYLSLVNEKFLGIDQFIEKTEYYDNQYEYVVAWVDCFNKKGIRGIITAANHINDSNIEIKNRKFLRIPIDFPSFVLNNISIKIFNYFYYYYHLLKPKFSTVYFDEYFYPLDNIKDWNKMYGKKGFYQYQFVIPMSAKKELKLIFDLIRTKKQGSFLAVLKIFGSKKSGGLISFPEEGYTLALDFPNKGDKTLELFKEIDQIVKSCGGSLYPAKDSRKECAEIIKNKTNFKNFAQNIDPIIQSNFSKEFFNE